MPVGLSLLGRGLGQAQAALAEPLGVGLALGLEAAADRLVRLQMVPGLQADGQGVVDGVPPALQGQAVEGQQALVVTSRPLWSAAMASRRIFLMARPMGRWQRLWRGPVPSGLRICRRSSSVMGTDAIPEAELNTVS